MNIPPLTPHPEQHTHQLKIPLFLERVSAGFPSPAQGYVEHMLDLNQLCVQHPSATFFVRVQGDSMIDAGIYAMDILIVDCSLDVRHQDIIVASLDGEMTVKQFEQHPKPRLVPCNPAYPPIEINESHQFEIFGVVTNIIRKITRASANPHKKQPLKTHPLHTDK
ncbi:MULTISPECIES: translesion error-prone DNA polymerase V autoproteolytic subunit [Nitrincola]|uniref:Peptidase S24/S26A/S26B/S26C domain-containing protein n=1 Tax=Nitrincola nitratireducens TaxID=1229521 RepID=W9VP58_9GAMM|nr:MULTISPECIES: translesion error-prone DNA polymerase V autoproteolytic subunit [Nitrincola]EXJ12260.1 hypothetical protein D791_01149 [Nitrincola nitratireducens]